MTNFFKQIKQIFTDNKEYFVRCTLMSIIAALIIGLSIGLSVPVSAAEEPTESDQVVIPAGTYFGVDVPSSASFNVNFLFTSGSYNFDTFYIDSDFIMYQMLSGDNRSLSAFVFSTDSWVDNYRTITVSFDQLVSLDFATWFNSNYTRLTYTIKSGSYKWNDTITTPSNFRIPINGSLSEVTISGYTFVPSFTYINTYFDSSLDSGSTVLGYTLSSYDIGDVFCYSDSLLWEYGSSQNPDIPLGFGQTFDVTFDTVVDSDFYLWFYANTTVIGGDKPGEPTTSTISAGYYKVRDSWNTSGFPVTNDSIEFRYYDEFDQSYIEAEGIAFLIENRDMVSIWYMDDNVYLDGWNIEGAKFIEVTQDIAVEPEFYTVFNNVYAPSSEETNEFDSGYAAGYVDGRSDGYDIGYRQGYAEGLSDGDTNIFVDIIGGTLAAVDSFTIFGGFSLLDLISTLLGGMALVWILKLLAGG